VIYGVPSFITIVNNTTYPVISVYDDDECICEGVLKNSVSEKITIKSGTVRLKIKENREKVFEDLWLSLTRNDNYCLIIKNSKSIFLDLSKH